ncbi:MAG: hypothetical protein QHI38_02915, partial [Armatimonadota bacterium]|nr:hypothetical protein [Armatimonadota bacterium]
EQVPLVLGAYGAPVEITDGESDLSGLDKAALTGDAVAQHIWKRSPFAVTYDFVHTAVTLDYGREPDVKEGEPFRLTVTLANKMPDCRHIELVWHLPECWEISPAAVNHLALWSYGANTAKVEVELIPRQLEGGTYRGFLEVRAQGRPTVGTIPLVFFA